MGLKSLLQFGQGRLILLFLIVSTHSSLIFGVFTSISGISVILSNLKTSLLKTSYFVFSVGFSFSFFSLTFVSTFSTNSPIKIPLPYPTAEPIKPPIKPPEEFILKNKN